MLEYSLVELVFLDLLLDHVIGLLAGLFDPLNGFGLLFLQKSDSIVQLNHILLLFYSESSGFLPRGKIARSEALGFARECMVLAILEIIGPLAILIVLIVREVWWRTRVFVIHRVNVNVHIDGLVVSILVGLDVIGADHVLALILLILSCALISLMHEFFVRIVVGGHVVRLSQLSVASMGTSRASRIENVVAVNTQVFVRLSELIGLESSFVSHTVFEFSWLQNTAGAHDVLRVIAEVVTGCASLPSGRRILGVVFTKHRNRFGR